MFNKLKKSPKIKQSLSSSAALDSVSAFKRTFIEQFTEFKQEVSLFASGNTSFNDSWKDTLGKEGIGVTVGVTAGVFALLGALEIIGAAISAGVAIPITVAGVAIGVAFHQYRGKRKQKQYTRANEKLERDNISEEIERISDLLLALYANQLTHCTIKDAVSLAEACFKGISYVTLKSPSFNFDQLLYPATLQGIVFQATLHMPKLKLQMNIPDKKKYNTRGMVTHPALYCEETNRVYRCGQSKPLKYGILFFATKEDFKEYREIVKKLKGDSPEWVFTKMRPSAVSILKHGKLFREYKNDETFGRGDSLSPRQIVRRQNSN